jgi:TRAP-type uncharacterized transport system substrate-binding protein
MSFSVGRVLGIAAIVATVLGAAAHAAEPRRDFGSIRGVVELETESATSISVRIAEDLADLVDDGATRRVLPVVGKGSLQNVTDLRLLRGVDMAILQQDVLDYARKQRHESGLENVTYVTKLYNEEFHLLARREIKSIDDLAGQRVSVDRRGGGTAITAVRLFDLLRLPVFMSYDDQQTALHELKAGRIAALAYVTARPAPLFRDLAPEDGLHFIALPLGPAITRVYTPALLTVKDYPGLVRPDEPIDTVAVGTVLAVANLTPGTERYSNVVNFVDAFFTQFQSLLEPTRHPKWAEVNLTAEVPGWRRFPPAEQWLRRNSEGAVAAGGTANPADLQLVFQRFLDQRLQLSHGQGMTQEQKDELFGQFQRWQADRSR